MKRLAILAAWLLASSAGADSVKAPAGWKPDPPAAISMSQQLGAVSHFNGQRSVVTTEVYRADRGSLFVTRISAGVADLDETKRNRAATAELDDVLRGVTRAGDSGVPDAATSRSLDGKLLEAAHKWHDKTTGVVTSGRIVVATDAQQMVAVSGECVLASDAYAEVVKACDAALATLDPGVTATARVPLTIVKDPSPPDLRPRPDTAPSLGSSGTSLVESGPRPSLPPMQIAPEPRERDRRPIYVGLGLIVLAALFWWNRKNREKIERDYEQRLADKPASEEPAAARSAPAPKGRDGDADDLHAAATEDDGTKEVKS
jgi:hypothetical protein